MKGFYVVSMTRLWGDLSNLRLSASQSAHNEEATLKPVHMETARLQGSQPLVRGTDIVFEELWEPWRKITEIFGKWASDATADTYPSNWEIRWSSGEKVTLTSLHSAKCNIVIRLYLIQGLTKLVTPARLCQTKVRLESLDPNVWNITLSQGPWWNPFHCLCEFANQDKRKWTITGPFYMNRIESRLLYPGPHYGQTHSLIPFICFQETSCWRDRSVMDMNQNVPYIVKKIEEFNV